MVQDAALPRGIRVGLALSVSVVLLSLAAILALRSSLRQPALPVFGQVPEFSMVAQDGRTFTQDDLAGRVHLIGFIYTSCPDICPAITAQMRVLQTELARSGLTDQVHLVSITVDPEYDTPERLAAYAQIYSADTASWHFLTGRPHHVRQVVEKGFLVGIEQVETDERIHAHHHGAGHEPDYRVDHGGRVALVDPEGRIRAYHSGNLMDTDEVMAQIRLLLAGR